MTRPLHPAETIALDAGVARLSQDCIRKVECIEYHQLGFVVDDKGNDFFAEFMEPGGH